MLRASARRLHVPRPVIDEARLAMLLAKMGVDMACLPRTKYVACNPAGGASHAPPCLDAFDDFIPLFTPHFTLERLRHVALGHATIQAHLCNAVHGYMLHRGHIVSSNVVRQLVACFDNALALRYLAEQVGFIDFANSSGFTEANDFEAGRDVLAQLREPPHGPSDEDVRGTAFERARPPGSRSLWGLQLAHAIGAIRLHCGDAAARKAVAQLWQLDGAECANLPMMAARFVTELASSYPAGCLVEALFAAQRVLVSFESRCIPIRTTGAGGSDGTATTHDDPLGEDANDPLREEEGQSAAALVRRSAGLDSSTMSCAEPQVLPKLGGTTANVTPAEAHESLAAGPGLTELLSSFKRQHGSQSVAQEGWLTQPEATPWSSSKVVFATLSSGNAYFADLIGVKQPREGSLVYRLRPRKPVTDPDGLGATASKDGVEINTYGMPAADFVRSFRSPGRRQFEVSLITRDAAGHGPIVASKAVASRYSVARNAAATGALEGVLIDLMRIAASDTAPPSH